MTALRERYDYLFHSTKGLALVAIAMISLVTVIFGMISGPMAELGIRDFWVRLLGMQLLPSEREGRIIMLYHSIAMAVVAIEVYFITNIMPMPRHKRSNINAVVTVGYLLSLIFGLWFAYFGHNYVFHGLFIAGQSLMFFGGLLLAAALWPWRQESRIHDTERAHTRGGVDLERMAFFVMALATLGSVLFGAVPGANFGNGFETFLAEDIIRQPVKTGMQRAVVGHLHIMLTLIAVALALLVGNWMQFKGKLHKVSMLLMILGTVVITIGVWAVVPFQPIAHKIIYGGSMLVLLSALLLVVFSWRKLIADRTAALGLYKPGLGQKLRALLHDPLKFGATWQMVFMNFVVTFVGIFMAIRLDEIMRIWPAREERITLTGHWHILAGIIATIILFYYADMVGMQGRARKWFGWVIIIASDIAFAAVTLFSTKRLFVVEAEQQGLVNWTMILVDAGLALVLTALGIFLLWRLIDLFKPHGSWSEEPAEDGIESEAAASPPPVVLTGIDPDTWAVVPAGPFLMGLHEQPAALDYDFEMMVTDVTNAQYAAYLNEALEAGEAQILGDTVGGFYAGDAFHGHEHEEEIAAGYWPYTIGACLPRRNGKKGRGAWTVGRMRGERISNEATRTITAATIPLKQPPAAWAIPRRPVFITAVPMTATRRSIRQVPMVFMTWQATSGSG